jgi:hypothetical protein
MRTARVSRWWSALPLAVWCVCAVGAVAALYVSGAFRVQPTAADLYDSGTRAAIAGDLPRAIIDLRRAQRISGGLLPLAGSLSARIDSNLAEARARVAAARVTEGQESEATPRLTTDAADSPRPGSLKTAGDHRPTSDRVLAITRAVPISVRAAAATMLLALLIAIAAMRSFSVAAGMQPRPRPLVAAAVALAAALAAGFAFVDRIADSRQVEAVLLRAEVPRSGPDDLTYPPALAAAFPAGTELLILGKSENDRWVRIARAGSNTPASSAATGTSVDSAMWIPRSAIELISGGEPG